MRGLRYGSIHVAAFGSPCSSTHTTSATIAEIAATRMTAAIAKSAAPNGFMIGSSSSSMGRIISHQGGAAQ